MDTNGDRLIRALLKSDSFRLVINGAWYSPQSPTEAADLISAHRGGKIHYRRRGFVGYPQGRFAAVIHSA